MINYLVSNDDGIRATGITALIKALSSREGVNVYVCAPDGQCSGNSQSISLNGTVYVSEVKVDGAKLAWQTSGTPADCVKIGLQKCEELGLEIDMVFAGINMGSNVGKDTLYSGTVGAAKEAAVSGYKAVALSVAGHHCTHFDGACNIAIEYVEKLKDFLTPKLILNINVPDLPEDEIKGVKFTKLGPRYFKDRFWEHVDEGPGAYKLDGAPGDFSDLGDEYDVCAMQSGYASITPLHFDYTDYRVLEDLKKWEIEI